MYATDMIHAERQLAWGPPCGTKMVGAGPSPPRRCMTSASKGAALESFLGVTW